MPSTKEITCKCGCGKKRHVRTADIKRGWGLFFNKKCKARHQEKSTGQYKSMVDEDYEDDSWLGSPMQSGYFGHGQN